ncbi:OLC1v1028740C1 [Oldenlandia corymbosa var. corymbosa]|uniref:OLC1v1028740C1 n=1 Tax=Oldenlandia corymbosa var. corymbosa TaxID=529605 RepID=A0AAV1CCW4_OLDCO|nr:OLC1v1028740C1 [Oldenlandia corymbosa var. corymbosa]
MALNYSHRPLFPAHKCQAEFDKRVGGGAVGIDGGCSSRRDIIDLLPSDPFGMDIQTTFTAISGWLEDHLEVMEDFGGYRLKKNNQDYGLFAGFSVVWNNNYSLGFDFQSNWKNVDKPAGEDVNKKKGQTTIFAATPAVAEAAVEEKGYGGGGGGGGGGVDLLNVGMVCKSLYNTVKTDPLLWRDIHIEEQPLNERITDEALVELTSRAHGNLHCLSLVECPRITDSGIRRVLQSNPRLNKLCVPGCTRLSIEGLVTSLKDFASENGSQPIRYLRIGGLSGVTHDHFEDLKVLLGADKHHKKGNYHKPHFFLRGKIYVSCDDDRAIDIEVCPRCDKYRLVFDCPSVSCQVKDQEAKAAAVCRACAICIPRCVQCGRCISDSEYEETFCLDNICSECCLHLSES